MHNTYIPQCEAKQVSPLTRGTITSNTRLLPKQLCAGLTILQSAARGSRPGVGLIQATPPVEFTGSPGASQGSCPTLLVIFPWGLQWPLGLTV